MRTPVPKVTSGMAPGDLTMSDVEAVFRERFAFSEVWEAFEQLDTAAIPAFWDMCDAVYRVGEGAALPTVAVRYGAGPGPYWVLHTMPRRPGSRMATLHPLNGDEPRILDFAIAGSSRPIMTIITALAGANFNEPA